NELNADLDHLLTSSESATIFLDEHLRVRRMTTKISELFNLLPQDIGRPFEHITSRLEWPTMMQDIEYVFHNGEFWESELQHHDGRWFLCRVRPYSVRPDECNGVNLSLVDITTKQAMLEQLAASEHRLRAIMEEVNDGYWDWKLEPDGSPTDDEYFSPSFKAMFGFEDHELENTPSFWAELIDPDDHALAVKNFEKHLKTDGAHPYDQLVRYTHRDGSPMWVICRGIALKRPDGTWDRMVGTHQDVTKLKRVEEELRRSNAELDQFTAIVSHDLKEPLRMVASFSKLLVEKYASDEDPDARMYSEFIEEGVMRMDGLIQDLLEFSRLTARASVKEQINLLGSLSLARDNLLAQLKKADAQLTWDALPDVSAVPIQMTQVFQNLLSNAVKFREPERPLTVHIGCVEEHAHWVISVRDNGIGIEPRSQERVFEMFQRGQAKREMPGNGVGLSTVKKIVEQHGGVISVESVVGEGSVFVFTLPK
ncbi:MAG: ATP-binding protein, partial [Myxococcota bacterium]